MDVPDNPRLTFALFCVATLYASVGQAGASGYIAVFGLTAMTPAAIKVAALLLNLIVAAIGAMQFWRAGRLSWQAVYPFAILGFPFSFLGGAAHLPGSIYFPLVGAVLVLTAMLMVRAALQQDTAAAATRPAPFVPALLTGAVIGFLSGTTGTGGGVFLAPVVLAMRWGTARQTATICATYNLINSAAALLGAHSAWKAASSQMPIWSLAVAVGGTVGAFVGSRYLPDRWLWLILAVLLFASGLKFLLA